MINNKEAQNRYPIHPLLKKRWSPRAFSETAIEAEKLQSVFEAARWSASAGNQQPWRIIIGQKGDETWQKIYDTLEHYNQVWAHRPWLLGITCGRTLLNDGSGPNPYYAYDTGQFLAHLSIQATAEGLYVHQMGGFDKTKAREFFEIPDPYEPLSAFALGYMGELSDLDEFNQKREVLTRERKENGEWLFSGTFGQASDMF
jgi:nitroreductase